MKYALYLNNLTPDPNDFAARVVDAPTRTLKDLMDDIIHPGSGLTEGEVVMVISALERAIQKAIQRGENIDLSFLKSTITIQGVFNHKDETFNPNKHTLVLNWKPGASLYKQLEGITLEKVPAILKRPVLVAFNDLKSKTTDTVATPGRIGTIEGSDLKIDTEDTEQGLFFINDKSVETKVSIFSKNTGSGLHFEIPETLKAGNYRIEVRNRYKGSKTLRTGSLEQTVEVL